MSLDREEVMVRLSEVESFREIKETEKKNIWRREDIQTRFRTWKELDFKFKKVVVTSFVVTSPVQRLFANEQMHGSYKHNFQQTIL